MSPRTPHTLNSPHFPGSSRHFSHSRRARTGVVSAAAILLIPVVVVTGSDAFRAALDFTTGVLSLVALTASVVWGLVASDRLFLTSRQRLLAQGVHRATAVASLGFLLLHVSVKLALAHVTLVEALIPFGAGATGSSGLIGLGVLAGLLMVATGVTGALRSSMASPAALAARWRATHMLAYPAWCLALLHGLYAGRQPKTYVVVLYGLCLLGVAGAVALRAAPRSVKRKVAARILAFLDPGPRAPGAPEGVLRNTRADSRVPDEVIRNTPPGPHVPGEVIRNTYPEAPPRPAPPPPSAPASAGVGFSAAYRAVSAGPRIETPPEVAPAHRWPAPSPPPPAQAPRSSYNPLHETPYEGVPAVPAYEELPSYEGGAPHSVSYGAPHSTTHDVSYSTTHDVSYGAPHSTVYEPDAAYEPPTEPLPGPFQAPAPGEPWTTPYGGPQ